MILSRDDLKFLKELAHLYTAKPVFYQIMTNDPIVGVDIEYADELCILIGDEYEMFLDIIDAKEFLIENEYVEELELDSIDSLEELHDYLKEHDIDSTLTGLKHNTKEQNAFLTKKAYEKHVTLNHYHYKDPKFFVNHAWRNPELERLLKIIEKFADIEIEMGE